MDSIFIPPHGISLFITHDEHKSYYATLSDDIDSFPERYSDDRWISPDDKMKAIAENEIWTMQWYPVTPIGSHTIHASSLDVMNQFVRQIFKDEATAPDSEFVDDVCRCQSCRENGHD